MIVNLKLQFIKILLDNYKATNSKKSKWYIWYIKYSKNLLEELKSRYKLRDKSVLVVIKKYDMQILEIITDYNDIKIKGLFYGIFRKLNMDLKYLASLRDSILVSAKGKQYYGTQFFYDSIKLDFRLYPIINIKTDGLLDEIDIKLLNRRRKRIGLSSFYDEIKMIMKITGFLFNKKIYTIY